MAVKLKSLKADVAREKAGDWIEAAELGEGVAFKVRGINYPEFQAKRDREMKRLAQRYGSDPVPQDEADRIQGRLLAEDILLDWRGFDEPYTADTALATLEDPAFREVRQAIIIAASRITQVKVEFIEEAVKNSAAPSAKS